MAGLLIEAACRRTPRVCLGDADRVAAVVRQAKAGNTKSKTMA